MVASYNTCLVQGQNQAVAVAIKSLSFIVCNQRHNQDTELPMGPKTWPHVGCPCSHHSMLVLECCTHEVIQAVTGADWLFSRTEHDALVHPVPSFTVESYPCRGLRTVPLTVHGVRDSSLVSRACTVPPPPTSVLCHLIEHE